MQTPIKIARYAPCTIHIHRYGKDAWTLLLQEPSLIALEEEDGLLKMVGAQAGEYIGRTGYIAGSPLRYGVIADFDTAAILLQIYLKQCFGWSIAHRKLVFCVPVDLTGVELRAFRECGHKIGAKKVLVCEKSFSQAVHDIPPGYRVAVEILPDTP